MAEIGPGAIPMVSTSYPHMMAADNEVWTRFLESGMIEIERVWYDVHVGNEVKGDWQDNDVRQKISRGLTRKRIDVVARVEGDYWVIEVKPVAMHFAVGQVLTYERLFIELYSPELATRPVIVCDMCDTDIINVCQLNGVMVIANQA